MKNIFDILENTEDDIMETITDLSPELDEAKFEKLFAKSERDYKIKKKEMERAKKEEFTEENSVSGVDRVRRPIWIRSMVTAASVVLIAGVVFGSAAFMHRSGKLTDKGGGTPTVTAVTTDKQSTETTVNSTGATSVKTTETQAVTTVSTSAQESIAQTNVQVVGVQEADVTTAIETTSQDETFVGRLNQDYQENYRKILTKMVDEAVSGGEDYFIDYGLKDLTGDGTPELIVKKGHFEVDSFVTVYNSEQKVIGDKFRGSYTGFYENSSGDFVFVTAHMGYFCASYPLYDAASDQLTIGTQNEKEYGEYGTYEDVEALLQEEGLTKMNTVSIYISRGSITSYYGGQTFDYPYFGIII